MKLKKYQVIGNPVTHSLSPLLYNTLFEYYKINAHYDYYTVTDDEQLKEYVCQNSELAGFNVTTPFKTSIIKSLDLMDDFACLTHSVNTVVNEGGKLKGYSTDGYGFVAAAQETGFSFKDKNITFLGAGSVMPPLLMATAQTGARGLTIFARTPKRALPYREMLKTVSDIPVEIIPLNLEGDLLPLENTDLLVNATSMGMPGNPWPSLKALGNLPPKAKIFDLVYKSTALTDFAKENGQPIVFGLSMLVELSMKSFEYYTDIKPNRGAKDAVVAALKDRGISL